MRDGALVVTHHAAANPQAVMREVVAQKIRFTDLKTFHVLPVGYTEYLDPANATHFKHITTFMGPASRAAAEAGMVEFIPSFFKDVPALMGTQLKVDAVLLNLSPPDNEGWCSLGVSCDYAPAAIRAAKTVIAQLNEAMPRVGGRENAVHISEVDYVVECNDPLPEVAGAAVSDVEREIARNVAGLVEDGDTLQLGIGAVPDTVLGFLAGHKHLGIHSEILSDSIVSLIESGAVDGSKKTVCKGKAVATFLVGSKVLWDFVGRNDAVEMRPVDWVNDPYVVGQNYRMVSVNSAIEVDLTGQVNAEAICGVQFSGVGGQVDFVRGARLSKGGRSIIALPATAKGGSVSRIGPSLCSPAVVTTSRNDVDFVVTEYGVAALRGRSLRERAEALRAIAHPEFRDKL